jgi:hypothetical protein
MSRRRGVEFEEDEDEPKNNNNGDDDGDNDDDGDDDDDDRGDARARKRKKAASSSSQSASQRRRKAKKTRGNNGNNGDDDNEDGGAYDGGDNDNEDDEVKVLSSAEEQALVASLMRYALAMDLTKQPITREGINRVVLVNYAGTRVLKPLVAKATTLFQRLFAYNLVPLQRPDAANAKRAAPAHAFALTSMLPPQVRALIPLRDQSYEQLGLVTTIVALLFLNDGQLTKPALFAQLARLGFDADKPHPTFGAWEKLIDSKFCVEQKYLAKSTVKGDNGLTEVVYAIGPRARAELDERQMLHYVAQVYGHSEIDERALKELRELQVERRDGVAWAKEEPLRDGDGGAPAAAAAAANDDDDDNSVDNGDAAAAAAAVPRPPPRVMARRGRAAAVAAADDDVDELDVSDADNSSRRQTPVRRPPPPRRSQR